MAKLGDIVRLSQVESAADAEKFDHYRKEAFVLSQRIYDERAVSYNVDHGPTAEMPFGCLSIASELFKRVRRMCGLLTPIRQEDVRDEEFERLIDTCVDMMNYASWQYGLVMLSREKIASEREAFIRAETQSATTSMLAARRSRVERIEDEKWSESDKEYDQCRCPKGHGHNPYSGMCFENGCCVCKGQFAGRIVGAEIAVEESRR